MKPPRIYSGQALHSGATVGLSQNESGHVSRTLRLKAGDAIVLFDGSGRDFDGIIQTASARAVTVSTGNERQAIEESPLSISLLQGLCRTHRMDAVIQKATELGVAGIQGVSTERCIVRIDPGRSEKKLEHWRRVAISAAEQCGRSVVPDIAGPVSLQGAIENHRRTPLRLILDPTCDKGFTELPASASAAALLIGPEGGFTDAELDLAQRGGFQRIRLGPRILRTETAPIAAVSILQFLLGDL